MPMLKDIINFINPILTLSSTLVGKLLPNDLFKSRALSILAIFSLNYSQMAFNYNQYQSAAKFNITFRYIYLGFEIFIIVLQIFNHIFGFLYSASKLKQSIRTHQQLDPTIFSRIIDYLLTHTFPSCLRKNVLILCKQYNSDNNGAPGDKKFLLYSYTKNKQYHDHENYYCLPSPHKMKVKWYLSEIYVFIATLMLFGSIILVEINILNCKDQNPVIPIGNYTANETLLNDEFISIGQSQSIVRYLRQEVYFFFFLKMLSLCGLYYIDIFTMLIYSKLAQKPTCTKVEYYLQKIIDHDVDTMFRFYIYDNYLASGSNVQLLKSVFDKCAPLVVSLPPAEIARTSPFPPNALTNHQPLPLPLPSFRPQPHNYSPQFLNVSDLFEVVQEY